VNSSAPNYVLQHVYQSFIYFPHIGWIQFNTSLLNAVIKLQNNLLSLSTFNNISVISCVNERLINMVYISIRSTWDNTSLLKGSCCAIFSFLCSVLSTIGVCPFFWPLYCLSFYLPLLVTPFFLLATVLSVLLFTTSGYTVGILKRLMHYFFSMLK
jgi:hypothetical protein